MQWSAIESRLLPFAILGLGAYAHWQPYPPAWGWAIFAAMGLAVLVFIRALAKRKQVFMRPLSIAVTAFVATKLVFPVLVMLVGLPALLSSYAGWTGPASFIAIMFAVVSLL